MAYDYGEDTIKYKDSNLYPFVGANMAIRKKCFKEIGLFHTELGLGTGKRGEDTEYFLKLEKSKNDIYYCGKALVWHKVDKKRLSYISMAKWYMASGRTFIATGKEKINLNAIHYFGIPRYFIRDIASSFLSSIKKFNNRNAFLKLWMRAFWDIGKVIEYRRIRRCRK